MLFNRQKGKKICNGLKKNRRHENNHKLKLLCSHLHGEQQMMIYRPIYCNLFPIFVGFLLFLFVNSMGGVSKEQEKLKSFQLNFFLGIQIPSTSKKIWLHQILDNNKSAGFSSLRQFITFSIEQKVGKYVSTFVLASGHN